MENSNINTASSDNVQYTINLDVSGMNAIVGSLYKNDRGSSSTSFYCEPSTPFGRDFRKERSFHNFEPSSSSSVRHQKSIRPRRHKGHRRPCTIDHAPTLADETNITVASVSEQEESSPVRRSSTSNAAAAVEQEESINDNNKDDKNNDDGHNDDDHNDDDDDDPMLSCPMPTSPTTAAHSGELPPSSDRKDDEPSTTSDRHKKPTTTTSTTSSRRRHRGLRRRRRATVDFDDFASIIHHQQKQQQQQEQQHAPASYTPLQKEDSMIINSDSIHDDHDHNNNVSSSRPPLGRLSSCKRVSWMSNLHSVSLFDLSKSPDTTMPMNSDKLNDVISNSLPPPPLVLDKEHKGGKKRTEKMWGRSNADWDEELQSHQRHQHNHTSKHNKKKKKTAPPTTTKKQPIIKVISLPWNDHRGVQGEYTGEVNSSIQPHGKGTFCTTENDDSTVVYSASLWKNGEVVSAKISVDYNIKEGKKMKEASTSTTTTTTTTASGVTATTRSSSSRRRRSSSSNSFHRSGNSTGSARTRGFSCLDPLRRRSSIGLAKTQLPCAGLSAPKPRPVAAAASSSSADHRHHPQSSADGDSSSGDEVKDMTSHVVVQYPPSYLDTNKHIENDDADDLDPKYSPTMSDQTPTFNATTSTTFLPGYHLGYRAQKRSHMIILSKKADPKIAIANVLSLKSLDFAFVLRGNGDWTYSIVADKPTTDGEGLAIRFVLDVKGSTKTIRKKYWGRGIRLINNAKIHSSTHQKKEDEGVGDEHYPISEDESSAIKEIMGRRRKVMVQAKQQTNISEERGRGASSRESDGPGPVLEEASSPSIQKKTMRSQTLTSSQRFNDSEASSSVESMTNRLKVSPQRISKKEATQHPKLAAKISKKKSKDERRAPGFPIFLGSLNQSMTSVAAVIAPTSPRRANANQRLQQHRFRDSRRLSMNSGFSDAAVIAPPSLLGELSLDDSREDNIGGNTIESKSEAMMSLDYLGTLDGTLEEQQHQCEEERQRRKPSLYRDLLLSRTGEDSDPSSGEHWESSKPNSNEGGSSFMERDVGSSDNGEFTKGSNSSALDNSFHQSVHTVNLQGEMEKGRGGIYYHPSSTKQKNSPSSTKTHSSFHIATAQGASEVFPNRRGSTDTTSFHATAVPEKKTRRRSGRSITSSVGSVGSDLSSFSALLRGMHSFDNYSKCEEGSRKKRSSSNNSLPMERVRRY